MNLYVSKTNNKLNTKELNTEFISEYICLNPIYNNVTIKNPNTKILMDSGAFQDKEKEKRLTLEQALNRQLDFEKKVGFISERIVAYDYIGNIKETIESNKYLAEKREELKPRQLVLMIQGNNTHNYIYCLVETLLIAKPEDCIGFGGVALAGRENDTKFKLLDAFKIGLPIIYNSGIKDIHIFGVGTFTVLKEITNIKNILKQININTDELNISCDTSAFEVRSTMGSVINLEEEKWEKVYTKAQKYIDYHPADLTIENIKKALQIIGKL